MQPAAEFDFSAYVESIAAFIRTNLPKEQTRSGVAGLMALLTTAVEHDLLKFGDEAELAKIDCAPGCGACCILNVEVLIPEAIAVTHFLLRHYPADRCNTIIEKLDRLFLATRWLEDDDRYFLRMSCAFLDGEGHCLIHKIRPLLCRSISSLDRHTCRDTIASVAFGGVPRVIMNLFQKRLFDAAYQGLSKGLKELGLESRPWRLTPAVRLLLERPDLAVDQFLTGTKLSRP